MQPQILQLLTTARTAAATQQPAQAERLLRQILSLDPNSLEALIGLGGLLLSANRFDEVAELAERAKTINPNAGPPYFQLGQVFLQQGRFQEAAEELETAARLNPNRAPLHHILGLASLRVGRGQRAEECFRRAIYLDPNFARAHAELGLLLLAKGDLLGATNAFRRAAELQPNSAHGQLLLGRALVESGQFAQGEERLRKAIQMAPALTDAYTLLARALQQQGRFAEAEVVLQELSVHQTDESQGFYLRVNGRVMTEQDRPMLERMEERAPELDPAMLRPVSYGLGKAFDDLGDYERAMGHFDTANRLSQERLNSLGKIFDAEAMRKRVDETLAQFTKEHIHDIETGEPSERPIFIVGMARSGTTLLEQMVSSHPQVAAAGELGTWTELSNSSPDREELQVEAKRLLAKLEEIAPSDEKVTVKTPQNYMVVGQILAALPNCRILQCRRNAIDTCLSIYMTSFQSGPEFAHDRASLVAAYREYLRIMDHWRSAVPPNRLMDVDYEQLVADREPVLREVMRFLGLEWDDAVMRHEANEHAISTPSLWQARQPIFSKSVERWRNYAPWLGALLELQDLESR